MDSQESCEASVAESTNAIKLDTLRVGDWQINGEVREVNGCRKLVVLADRPNERRSWILLRDLSQETCVAIVRVMMLTTLRELE